MLLNELLDKGGIVMGILIFLSVYTLAVVFYKIYQFIHFRAYHSDFLDTVFPTIKSKKYTQAAKSLRDEVNPVAQIIAFTLHSLNQKKTTEEERLRDIGVAGKKILRPFYHHVRGLEMVAHIAPLLGLLGTVIGMVRAFSSIEEVGSRVDPSLLAGGIWEALLTTVAGLSLAIPALAVHYVVENKIEQLRATMEENVAAILASVRS